MAQQNGEMVTYQKRVADFRGLLQALKPQLELALPRHVSADRLARVVLTSVQRVPKLLECTRESLLGCIMQAAQLGLEPDGLLGQAYLIPFKDTCTLVPGYKGLLKLARQSGEISSVTAHVVHAGDKFFYRYGLDEKLVHRPAEPPINDDKWEPGPMTAVYAVAKLRDGGHQFDVMYRHDVNRIRDNSQGYKASKRFNSPSPWDEHYEEMAKKTILRRLCKMLPASVELQTAVALDERADAGVPQELTAAVDIGQLGPVAEEPKPAGALDALAEKTKAKKQLQIEVEGQTKKVDDLEGGDA